MVLLFIMILSGFTVSAGKFELVYSGNAPSDELYTDHVDNIYFIEDHKIIKVEASSGRLLEYGSLSAGTITSADVSNPLQILLFYRDFNRLLFLNNKLSPLRSEINMSDLGIDKAILICSSGRGGFWVFSDIDDHLVYFNQQLQKSQHSMNISALTGTNAKPVFMTESQNLLYLHVPRKGILIFDRFASYMKTLPYTGPDRFRVIGGMIVFFDQGQLKSLDIESGEMENLPMPQEVMPDFADIQPERIYILSGNRIKVYSIR